jgi:nucleotide-binding universal stress UspA family protein
MIKTILVPATGSDTDIALFRSALTVARVFAAHLEILHVHADATAIAATMAADAGGGHGKCCRSPFKWSGRLRRYQALR